VLQTAHSIIEAAHVDAPAQVPRFAERLNGHGERNENIEGVRVKLILGGLLMHANFGARLSAFSRISAAKKCP
jgi:hypothetical protein